MQNSVLVKYKKSVQGVISKRKQALCFSFSGSRTLFVVLMSAVCIGQLGCKEVRGSGDATTERKEEGFVEIFNGKDLEGWEGNPTYWRVEDGNLVGEVSPETPLKKNTFVIWQGGQADDFELRLDVKITESGNSGINYRSELLDSIPYALRGYQADIDGKNRYTGQNYEERKRTTLAYRGEKVLVKGQTDHNTAVLRDNVKKNCWQSREVVESLGDSDSLKTKIRLEDWNHVRLVVQGNRLQHYVNGILMSDVTDNDSVNRKMSGHLGMQVHVGPPMKVAYKNIFLKEL
ncbi:DUF1080 domain-containing protein [Zobellia galactanivorans]|uniref:3-keto-disaccharide hydrolase n=1 Tax=Zobellia galactanivorans (strain DSM 12802 / CCUG 47099 / CIP 106680 / NCIMB 13871 / Dsij) TaxID=63186 RepID=UPI00209171E9|nr:DUF1080 domain-containing protein [Zobellia galactanivorans]MDO6810745.1 DUF1080 domain-containing protein [Zobellia galactanivorans]